MTIVSQVTTPFDPAYVLTYVTERRRNMTTFNATKARTKLYSLIDEATTTHKPITITGKRGNAVLLAEDDLNAINEAWFQVLPEPTTL